MLQDIIPVMFRVIDGETGSCINLIILLRISIRSVVSDVVGVSKAARQE
jgi:hypothetical protein